MDPLQGFLDVQPARFLEQACGAWPQADGASAGQAMSIASFSDLMSRDESGDLTDYRPPRDPLRRAADELLQARTLHAPSALTLTLTWLSILTPTLTLHRIHLIVTGPLHAYRTVLSSTGQCLFFGQTDEF